MITTRTKTSDPCHRRALDGSLLVTWLAVAFGALLIIGGRAAADPHYPTERIQKLVDSLIGFILIFLYILTLGCVAFECNASSIHTEPFIPAIVLSFSATMAYCLASSGWQNVFQKLFYLMISVLFGAIIEAATGAFKACIRLIEMLDTVLNQSTRNVEEEA